MKAAAVNSDLLRKDHELGKEALEEELCKKKRELWLRENREAIEAYNELVAKSGLFSDGLRGF